MLGLPDIRSSLSLTTSPCFCLLLPLPDFSQQLSELDSRSGVSLADFSGCGVHAVALRWEGLLLLVDPC